METIWALERNPEDSSLESNLVTGTAVLWSEQCAVLVVFSPESPSMWADLEDQKTIPLLCLDYRGCSATKQGSGRGAKSLGTDLCTHYQKRSEPQAPMTSLRTSSHLVAAVISSGRIVQKSFVPAQSVIHEYGIQNVPDPPQAGPREFCTRTC